jgi:hypothetical protein
VKTEMYSTPAPAYFAVPRAHVSTWAEPAQGTNLSAPATKLGCIVMASATRVASANAAKGATRKDATGGGAFEDPV